MSNRMTRVAALAALASALAVAVHSSRVCSQGGGGAAGSVADTLRALETARGQALIEGDTAAIARMTADEFVEIARTGQLRDKADNTGTFRGFPFAGKVWMTRIFVKRDDRWQAVAMQHTPIP